MEVNAVELLGYLATFFVAISFLFKSIIHLRIVNSIGAFLFAIYGLIIVSYPVALLNSFLLCVNIYQLWRLKKKEQTFVLYKKINRTSMCGLFFVISQYVCISYGVVGWLLRQRFSSSIPHSQRSYLRRR